MKVYESDFDDDFEMYVSDFKVGAPGYIYDVDGEWHKAEVTYVRFYNEPTFERLISLFRVSDDENICERFPHIFRDGCQYDDIDYSGEYVTDNFICWVGMKGTSDEIPEDEVDIEVIGYC